MNSTADLVNDAHLKDGSSRAISLQEIVIDNESYFMIRNADKMRPFLMSIVSDSNHWLFISSNGGLTAGRKNSDYALFPYYTDDKLAESHDLTGSKSIFRVIKNDQEVKWEPFSETNEDSYSYTRNLYKSKLGNQVLFEEINHDLELTFWYRWSSSNEFGFVRTSHLHNHSREELQIELVDGVQNLMPYGVGSNLQQIRSNLVDAYKRNELVPEAGLGIYALSAIIVDRAEPSEALKANVVWSIGLEDPVYLLSSRQLDSFRKGIQLKQEEDIKAEKGAYFISSTILLKPEEEKRWRIVANVNQGSSDIVNLAHRIQSAQDLEKSVIDDIMLGSSRLTDLVAASDGLQLTADTRANARHYANVLFNIMRGGIFDSNYQIEKWDFEKYLKLANKEVSTKCSSSLDALPDLFTYDSLRQWALQQKDADLIRLVVEYLPLKFSRRHGDPSRPWNRFSINTRSESDGTKILDYEGNWRDIFQNWEALGHSYPEFIDGMLFKFLNASTFDGYNPYRVTKSGFDWETIEPHDPWSYIGYWGDHQVIYLLKFLEFIQNHDPDRLSSYFDQDLFVYANVPYRIKSYEDILKNPKDTIDFDEELDRKIRKRRGDLGGDGALLQDISGTVYKVNFIEKVLATVLSKISNFIPEGGVWMNTQRPEWNDANNALVGNGVSMVTLYYLRRFLAFFELVLQSNAEEEVHISSEVYSFFDAVYSTIDRYQSIISSGFDNKQKKQVLDGLGLAGSNFRNQIYENGFSGKKEILKLKDLQAFIQVGLKYMDQSIQANKRSDGMYHAYNLVTLKGKDELEISYLSEMLEGQVAVLSAGFLSSEECLDVLDALKRSLLFRADQYSYILYPNKDLPRFMEKNVIPKEKIESSLLLSTLIKDGNKSVLEQDVQGNYHFNGNFNNAEDLKKALSMLPSDYDKLVLQEGDQALNIFEEVFNHKAFTGRSGTFFGYEGLGSIYWHMVSKLLLAVEECCIKAIEERAAKEVIGRFIEHLYEIYEGIGVHKSPELYGAFPIDPYSHTPATKGAQQPGMTGQVKEDILIRIGELGLFVKGGHLKFEPHLLRASEFLKEEDVFNFVDVQNQKQSIHLPNGTLAFTYCQVPIVYRLADKENITVVYSDGSSNTTSASELDQTQSQQLFSRSGKIERIDVDIKKSILK